VITVSRLRLRGWKCFREPQVLELEPKAYAVFAREVSDPARSNFCGKSSILEAIDFALYGRLAQEFKQRKKGWISRGEKSGEVDVTLSDGSRIVRSQSQSGSEQLKYFPPGAPEKGAMQEFAQKAIDELVGLSKEDFAATRYFRQGEMARLITLDPASRLDLVAGWLRLGPLQDCEADASEVLRELARRRDAATTLAAEAERIRFSAYERIGIAVGGGVDPEAELAIQLSALSEKIEACKVRVAEAEKLSDAEKSREDLRTAAEAYEQTVANGTTTALEIRTQLSLPEDTSLSRSLLVEARERHAVLVAELDEKLKDAAGAQAVADGNVRGKRTLARGEFDGTCPLVCAPCPAKVFVDQEGRKGKALLESALAGQQSAAASYSDAHARHSEAVSNLTRLDSRVRRLGELRAEVTRLKPVYDRWEALSREPSGPGAGGALTVAREELRTLESQRSELLHVKRAVEDARKRYGDATEEANRFERAARTAAAAVAIFGRGGAQRRVAEQALEEIQDQANVMMASCEIPLQVEVRWSRDGGSAATTCAACGEPFPRSEKIKVCVRCGGERGLQIINRLEIEPSAQSGGARDLCGIFVQLSAAAWLVADREACWSTAMFDEPLAALDQAMRRSLASHLPALLRDVGVTQALVIGHDRAALDALPGRIVVTSSEGWSMVRVEA
jgi:DNA repair exonuclease SbcCD ATPase subunit